MTTAYFSLGSNLGDRGANLQRGVETLRRHGTLTISSVYETEPVGGVEQDSFWNLVVSVDTTDSPQQLLASCQVAEEAAHRVRVQRWGPRTLDVDVLLLGDVISTDPSILIPHPRMWERRFVLAPLRELAPHLVSEDQLARAQGDVRKLGTLQSLR